MGITEKVAYLKGLAEGLGLDKDSKEGKLFAAIIDVLDDMALEIEDMQELQMELSEGLDAVSDDLEDIEDIVYEEWDEDDDYEDEEDEEDEEDSEDCYATTCPTCEEEIFFDESILEEGEVICQKVKAYVVPMPGIEPTEELKKEILDYCTDKIAKFAMPRELEFRTELPKTLVGKVAYRVLEEEANAAMENNE